ncbi:DNA-binding transcriptional LysR family regulator [Gillisia mitskevichiae]|uniref:DNA-binding transcriptional LysR family regulator n=1 Tax=Gillisia mitskevichiae TaxID=270921 RepID=A0A495NZ33_9FLAO|nr:LysR family transcriptional regulator [Gillisia mitskevichiae]RKS42820.1 DNA-binding transcriptional LysR family regulator [Gillisia mitskevichiae]
MVNLEWYRSFKAIYENKTLTKAAVVLYTSQPGVSLHLNSLEAYIGKKLFERTSRRMVPTEDGKQLYAYIIDAIEKLENAEQHFKKTSKKNIPSLNIGMCTETFQAIVEPEVPSLPFNLIAKFGDHSDLIKDLNNGILDLVITPKQKDPKKTQIRYEPFTKEKIILVAGSKTNLDIINKYLKFEQWSDLEKILKDNIWYSASNEMDHFRGFWFENFKKRLDFKPNYILPSISSIIRCLKNNTGFATIPDFLAQSAIDAGELKLVWEGKVITENTLYFATRDDLKLKKEIEVIKNIFKNKMS